MSRRLLDRTGGRQNASARRGQRFRDCWSEVFHFIEPLAERPFRDRPAPVSDDVAMPL